MKGKVREDTPIVAEAKVKRVTFAISQPNRERAIEAMTDALNLLLNQGGDPLTFLDSNRLKRARIMLDRCIQQASS